MPRVAIPKRKSVPKVWPYLGVTNPGKGLNNVIGDEYIANEEASSLENIMFVESGCPAKRNGHTALGTGLSNAPKGLASFYTPTTKYLLTIDGTALKYLVGTTWTSISGATFTTGKNTTFCQARGALYIWNGTDAGRKLDSALTLTAPTTTPSASFGIFYNGRQFVSGVATQPSRLYISNASDPADFTNATGGTGGGVGGTLPDNTTDVPGASVFAGTPANSEAVFVDISKDDGDKITGLAKFQEQLIIFKERSSWSLTFGSDGIPVVKQVSASIGCVSHRSIDNVDDSVFFLSRNGYYTLGYQANFTQPVPRTNELSATIHPIIETITAANLPTAASLRSGYLFLSSIATGGTTTNNKTLVYDTRFKGWTMWTNVNANAFTEFIDASNVKHLYYAADDEAQVYEIDTGYTDNGTAINSQWTSKAINFGDFSLTKQILYIDFEFRQITGSVSITVFTDGNTQAGSSAISNASGDTTGTFGDEMFNGAVWGGSNGTTTTTVTGTATANVPYRMPINKASRTCKIKISNSGNNETFTFLAFKIYYRPYNVQKFDSRYKLVSGVNGIASSNSVLTEGGDIITTE